MCYWNFTRHSISHTLAYCFYCITLQLLNTVIMDTWLSWSFNTALNVISITGTCMYSYTFPQPKDLIPFLSPYLDLATLYSLYFFFSTFILTPSFHLMLGLPRFLFPVRFHYTICLTNLSFWGRMTWLYHLSFRSSISCIVSFLISIFVLILSFLIFPFSIFLPILYFNPFL